MTTDDISIELLKQNKINQNYLCIRALRFLEECTGIT